MSSIFGAISVETPKFAVVKTFADVTGAELRKYAPQVRAEVLYDIAPNNSIMDGLNTPFRSLAGYIFGGNSSRTHGSSEKVAMTAPVVMQTGASSDEGAEAAKSAPSSEAAATGPAEKIAMTAPVVMQTGASADAAGAGGSGCGGKRSMCFIMPSQYKSVADLPAPKDPRVRLYEVPERTFAAIRFRGRMNPAANKAKEAELRAAAAKAGVKLSADPHAVQYCAYNPPWCLPWLATNDILIPALE
ncbi:hypothetical protein PLESTB_001076900 [Pleodorina starrii]|uniref:SOUL heme-binding protein n=1 Tax=Pleodorina starrii TaxID=330485 RepID=A0A9W6BQD9_9CHLO|nr:hypothetical protein PLESTM_001182200 [Pleodorina starrii]GLC56178.1 hypothetical protein PLESTB_001076900 [Pleodorina starrii]GLC74936.1 hypothetical protein PLESTF_001574800 [Pleodorina starrii]